MAALTDAPSVYVGGQEQSPGWSLTKRAVLAGVKITWGRESHLDKADPATAYVELIDTDGHLQGYESLVGQTLTIYRSRSDEHDWALRLFNGRVDKFDVEARWIDDPELHYERRVWVLKITASDRLADLARSVLPGPGDHETWTEIFGAGYWPEVSPLQRIWDIWDSGADKVLDALDWRDPKLDAEDWPGYVRVVKHDEGRSLLDMIEAVYNAHSLGFPNYEPHTNSILLAQPAKSNGLALEYANDTISLDVPDGFTIPASKVVAVDGYTASTGVDEAIDVVQVRAGWQNVQQGVTAAGDDSGEFTTTLEEFVTEHLVPGYNFAAGGRRELTVETDIEQKPAWAFATPPPPDPDPDPDPPSGDYEWPFSLSNVTSEYGWREWSSSFHAGMDFSYAGIGGAAIHPVGPGTVSQVVAWHSGWGNYVVVDHGNGRSSLYAHMVSPAPVSVGQAVTTSSTLGYVGNTGNSFGDHLHLETWLNGQHQNPRGWMTAMGVDTAGFVINAAGPSDPDGEWQQTMAARYAADLGQLTGHANLPNIRLDWRNFAYPYEVAYHFLRACVRPYAVYFPGSVFNTMLDAAALHQIIGGELVYHDGWTLDAWLAPALGTKPGLTVAQLVTNSTAEIRDFQEDITLADLGNVTIGAN